MSPAQLETTLLVAAVAAAAALPGCFLVLRRLALVGDAISHVLLFGIVVAFFIVGDLDSPWLVLGAAASGVLTVALVEALQRTGLVREDAAIGLVFPGLFALGTLLASLYLRSTHLDVDAVLLGHAELAITTPKVTLGPFEFGRLPTVVMTGVFLMNVMLTIVFFKELKLSTFDPALAAALGFMPGLIHYGLMGIVSLTTVAAFDAVGPVMVVAFLVVPAATALLLTERLGVMLILASVIGVLAAVIGVAVAFELRTNTAGTVATVLGALFTLVFLFSPRQGLIGNLLRRVQQRREFLVTMLTIHLTQHEGTPAEPDEARFEGLHRHLHWELGRVATVVTRAERMGLITRDGALLKLTPEGRTRARQMLGERG